MLDNLLRVGAAYLLAMPVAWEREKSAKSAGLRTFPLVAIASAGFVLTGVRIMGHNADSVSRIVQGLMTGIGFIGGGTILKHRGQSVHGTASAASVWSTGAIGASAALAQFEIAIVLSVVTFATLRLLRPLKKTINGEGEVEVKNAPEEEGGEGGEEDDDDDRSSSDRGGKKS